MKNTHRRVPWNKGKLIGQKARLKLKELWAIRVRLQLSGHTRNLALLPRDRFEAPRLRLDLLACL